jgi:hypothetical protein
MNHFLFKQIFPIYLVADPMPIHQSLIRKSSLTREFVWRSTATYSCSEFPIFED